MAWYAQSEGQVFGPYDDAQVKNFASEGRIRPDTQVAQSQEGPWVPASRVKGLFAGGAPSHAVTPPAARSDPTPESAGAALLQMHSQTAEQLESIAVSLTQIVAKVDGRGNASAANVSMPMQYKVLTQKDKWFSGKFDPEKLEGAINSYAAQGWRVCGVATATFPGFGGSREEMVVVMERES
jgi:hypothetical protein